MSVDEGQGSGVDGVGEVDHDLEDGQSWASASIKGLESKEYALPVGMRTAAARILQTMGTGKDPGERHLGVGWGTERPLERWARAYAAGNPRSDLAVMYGLGVVATMVAAQGGVVLTVPVPGSARGLDIPATCHFMVEAPSGWRKSTALNVVKEPLERALAAGLDWRRGEAVAGAKAALAALEAGDGSVGDKDAAKDLSGQVETVFLGGVCGLTHVKDPTVEALRNVLVGNGGCAAVLAGEADVFRNLTNYGNGSAGAGSLSFFLDLWGQDSIETVRVKGGVISMRKAALNLAVLFQTDVFAEVTAGKSGTGADSFMSRGVFGRAWVVEAYNSGAGEAGLYADDAEMGSGWDGSDGEDLVLSEQDAALVELEGHWRDLVVGTSGYRAAKGRLRAWEVGLEGAGSRWKVPLGVARGGVEVDAVGDPIRRRVGLGEGGLLAYKRLHRMADAVKDAVDAAPPGVEAMWATLAARLVDHVLRDALAVCLASGLDEVPGAAIEDAAVRLLPWRIGMQATALAGRAGEIARGRIREEMRVNPHMADRDAAAVVRTVLLRMAVAKPMERAGGFIGSKVIGRAMKFAGWNGPGMREELQKGLDELVADPDSGVTVLASKPNVSGTVYHRYVISKVAVDDAATS